MVDKTLQLVAPAKPFVYRVVHFCEQVYSGVEGTVPEDVAQVILSPESEPVGQVLVCMTASIVQPDPESVVGFGHVGCIGIKAADASAALAPAEDARDELARAADTFADDAKELDA